MDPLKSLAATDSARRALSLLEEFRNFALKGNVIDLAVGVIIGAAFGKIVDSLVKHILMPTLGLMMPGEQGYLGWKLAVGAKEVPYGLFLGEVVNFVIVAFALYLFIVKFLGFVMKTKEPAPRRHPPRLRRSCCSPRSATCSGRKAAPEGGAIAASGNAREPFEVKIGEYPSSPGRPPEPVDARREAGP